MSGHKCSCCGSDDCGGPKRGALQGSKLGLFAGLGFLMPLVLAIAGASLWTGSRLGEGLGALGGFSLGFIVAFWILKYANRADEKVYEFQKQ